MNTETRPIHEIADDIVAAWPHPYFGAVPYLRAMGDLNSIEEHYGCDSARSIVAYFLANASTFRGEQARELKAELKTLLKKGDARGERVVRAWHFTNGMKLRNGQPLEAGRVYHHNGAVVPCRSGLHASTRLIDALKYAPGSILSRVEMRGELIEHGEPVDKVVGRERKVSWHIDATRTLWLFACWAAEDALQAERKAGREPHPASWAAPRARRAWLDGKITDAQLGEAHNEANSAAYSTFSLAFSAAFSAACSATPQSAAHSSANGAADRAAYSLADSAADRAARGDKAYRATRERQNRKLTAMILQAHAKEMK
jgi:hypothetical protein